MVSLEAIAQYEKAKRKHQWWWLKEVFGSKFVVFQFAIVVLFFIAGAFVWLAAPYSFETTDLTISYQTPSWQHIFGTDRLGRDFLTRVLFAMRTSVIVSVLTLVFGGFIITWSLGLIAGYFGGWRDWIIMRVGEVLSMIPGLFLIIFIAATVRPRYEEMFYSLGATGEFMLSQGIVDFSLIFFLFSLLFWVGPARQIRSQILIVRESLFVDAARVLGASDKRIIFCHILPNLMNFLILGFSSIIITAIGLELGLSFLGLGIKPPHPSFGLMFSEISSPGVLENHAYLLVFPSLIIAALMFAIKRFADNLIRVVESRS